MRSLKSEEWMALGALGVSLWAAIVSMRANGLSRKALAQSERATFLDKRPLLTVSPERSAKTNQYIKILPSPDDPNVFILDVGYRVTNVGGGVASNISAPRILHLSGSDNFQFGQIDYVPSPKISLAPGEARVMWIRQDLNVADSRGVQWLVNKNNDCKLFLTIGLTLSYESPDFPESRFSVTIENRLSAEEAQTLGNSYQSDSNGVMDKH